MSKPWGGLENLEETKCYHVVSPRAVSSHLSLRRQASCRTECDSSVERYGVLCKIALNEHQQRQMVFNGRNSPFFQRRRKTWLCWMHRFPIWRLWKRLSRRLSTHSVLSYVLALEANPQVRCNTTAVWTAMTTFLKMSSHCQHSLISSWVLPSHGA